MINRTKITRGSEGIHVLISLAHRGKSLMAWLEAQRGCEQTFNFLQLLYGSRFLDSLWLRCH